MPSREGAGAILPSIAILLLESEVSLATTVYGYAALRPSTVQSDEALENARKRLIVPPKAWNIVPSVLRNQLVFQPISLDRKSVV